jgi:hypothetical protein
MPKDSICVEVGVYTGDFSQMILEKINPALLYLVDPWEIGSDKNSTEKHYTAEMSTIGVPVPTAYSDEKALEEIKQKFSSQIMSNQIKIKKGFSYEVVDEFPDNFFDFVYIDACHLYDSVKADLEMFLPKLKTGGLMCGHDYANVYGFGVVKAVDEFIINNNLKWVATSASDGYDQPSFALKRT